MMFQIFPFKRLGSDVEPMSFSRVSMRLSKIGREPDNITSCDTHIHYSLLLILSHIMSLAPPAYITSLQNNIRARPISWEGAVRAKTITEADLKKIKSIDKVRKEQRKQTIEGDVDGFVTLFLGGQDAQGIFQAAAKREDIIQYLLVLIGDLMDGEYRAGQLLRKLPSRMTFG